MFESQYYDEENNVWLTIDSSDEKESLLTVTTNYRTRIIQVIESNN